MGLDLIRESTAMLGLHDSGQNENRNVFHSELRS